MALRHNCLSHLYLPQNLHIDSLLMNFQMSKGNLLNPDVNIDRLNQVKNNYNPPSEIMIILQSAFIIDIDQVK